MKRFFCVLFACMLVLGAAMAIYGYQNGASMSLYWADGHVYTEKEFDSLAESEEWTELPEGVSGLALELNNADVTIRQGDVFHISADYQRGSAPEATVENGVLRLRDEGVIDNLFLLPRNMGVACAANVGWELVPAPLYMKLDNDTAMVRRHWLRDLLALWSHGQPVSNLGGAFNREILHKTPGCQQTPHGELGLCVGNLPGQAVLVPQAVSEKLAGYAASVQLPGSEDLTGGGSRCSDGVTLRE